MNFFTFLATLILAFFGLFVGLVLSHYSEDELKHFKRYIPYLQLLVFVIIFLLFFWYLPFFIATCILVLSFAFIYLFWHRKNMNVLDYVVLGVLFALTSLSINFHLYMTLFVFIFGILSGALFYALHRKLDKKAEDILHHKHSGKHLSFGHLSVLLFEHYYFFLIVALSAYFVAIIFKLLFF